MSALDDIRNRRVRWPWGSIHEIHEVERYAIIESRREGEAPHFHIYIDGKDAHESFLSLDAALVGAVAYGNIGNANDARHMGAAARKVLGVGP